MPKKVKKISTAAARSSRPPLERMMRIHEALRAGGYPNCFRLGREMEVSYKTIQRDIDFMRDRMDLPIEYDAVRHGFHYARPVASLPTVTVSEGELVALLVAQKALEQYRGTPFERPIASAFEKLAASLPAEQGVSIHELSNAVSFKPASLASADLRIFSRAADAVLHGREIAFDYAALGKTARTTRRMQPYHLGCISDQWYLIGLDPDRGAERTFALARMRRLRFTGRRFSKPEDFSIEAFLSGSFSAFQARETKQVRLRLEGIAAKLASERKWHASQKLKSLSGGRVEITLRVGIAPDLENWILSLGNHAEVLEPPELRERIARNTRAMAARYRTKTRRASP